MGQPVYQVQPAQARPSLRSIVLSISRVRTMMHASSSRLSLIRWRTRFVTEYVEIPLKPDDLKAIKPKDNVLAVHCHQTMGGQNIDVGLAVIRKRK